LTPCSANRRWPNADHFDGLAAFFGVPHYYLLKPDAVLHQRQDSDANSGRKDTLVSKPDTPVGSAFPSPAEGGLDVFRSHPDSELLSALLSYWDALTPERRLELVGHGMRLRSQSKAEGVTPIAGFGRG
jgi:hypothetical protein